MQGEHLTNPRANQEPEAAPQAEELYLIDAYWRAANYLSVGQIYLLDNPLLREPLRAGAHQAAPARPLGHDAGAELHLRPPEPGDPSTTTSNVIYIAGPGHGGPGIVANAYLEGTYTEVYPHIARRRGGTAAAVPAVLVPRRDPEPRRAGDARLDPRGRRARLLARCTRTARRSTTRTCSSCCVVGDGEAETGPLATSWHSNKFLDPGARRRGAADPASQRLQDRQPDGARADPATTSCASLLRGYGYEPTSSRATIPPTMHQLMAATLDDVARARSARSSDAPRAAASPTSGRAGR